MKHPARLPTITRPPDAATDDLVGRHFVVTAEAGVSWAGEAPWASDAQSAGTAGPAARTTWKQGAGEDHVGGHRARSAAAGGGGG